MRQVKFLYSEVTEERKPAVLVGVISLRDQGTERIKRLGDRRLHMHDMVPKSQLRQRRNETTRSNDVSSSTRSLVWHSFPRILDVSACRGRMFPLSQPLWLPKYASIRPFSNMMLVHA